MTGPFPFPTRYLDEVVAPSAVHPTEFYSLTDPALDENNHVQAGKRWRKTDSLEAPTWFEVYIRNTDNNGWILERAWTNQAFAEGEVPVADADGRLAPGSATAPAHATSHENGGDDEIDVTGLSGVLAEPQTPDLHATSHQNGGGDEISVAGLSGELADAQKVTVRKNSGSDVGTRSRLNLIEGSNISLTVSDDSGGGEVDITINSTASLDGSGTATKLPKWSDSDTLTDSAVTENSDDLTSTKPLYLPASSTSVPSLRAPHGSAPSSPTNGDIWTTTAGLFVRINGATLGPYFGGGGGGGTFDDLTDATISSPVLGQGVYYNGSVWRNRYPIENAIDETPASPNAEDDEFDAGSLDAKWTNAGSLTIAFSGSRMTANFPNATAGEFRQPYAPGANTAFTITAKFSGVTFHEDTDYVGIMAWDSSNVAIANSEIRATGGGTSFYKDGPGGSATIGLRVARPDFYLKLNRDASNVWTASFSWNGDVFTPATLVTGSSATTVAKIGFRFGQTQSRAYKRASIDWFRRT